MDISINDDDNLMPVVPTIVLIKVMKWCYNNEDKSNTMLMMLMVL